ncbi:type 1 phosphatases regulator YPI1 [Russula earlei]|uniref:Type 1 phosphatases regulator YPI1 n=1 Tax=Russula earlei TaxID=71964 RepID=A0ACC0UJT6_9AGAM|nr:type 1 phosphatases regulator YPI1 [Russula earlei]
MSLLPQSGLSSAMSREGSRTTLMVQNTDQRDTSAPPDLPMAFMPPVGTLRLRGGPRNGPRVVWDEEVVDNEGLGRKKSKICCIYHRERRFDESSEEEDSDSSGTGSDSDDATARPSGLSRHRHHAHGEGVGDPGEDAEPKRQNDRNRDHGNDYERMSPRKGKGKAG